MNTKKTIFALIILAASTSVGAWTDISIGTAGRHNDSYYRFEVTTQYPTYRGFRGRAEYRGDRYRHRDSYRRGYNDGYHDGYNDGAYDYSPRVYRGVTEEYHRDKIYRLYDIDSYEHR